MADSGSYDDATLARRAKIAEAMFMGPKRPIQHWTQGFSDLANTAVGGYALNKLDQQESENSRGQAAAIAKLLGGGGAPAAAPAVDSAPSAPLAPITGKDDFIKTMMPGVTEAANRTGLDPRLVMAQAALETGWGKSAPGNNFFGIKSHGVAGGNMLPTTEVINGQPVQVKDSFRAYANPTESAIGYADFLKTNPRYREMLGSQGLDAQVAALGKSGYATDPMYSSKVGQIARALQLPGTAQPMPQGAAPDQPSAAPAATSAASDSRAQIVQLLNSPNRAERKLGMQLGIQAIATQQKEAAPTDEMKEYRLYQQQGGKDSFFDYKSGLKKAGAQNINLDQRGENAFAKEAGSQQAKRFNEIVQGGQDAQSMVGDINALREIGGRITTGKRAEITAALGPYAEAAGIKIDGLDDLQAYDAIISKLAPRMRVPGSGASSDLDVKMFLKALPGLGKTPGGNEMIANTLDAMQQHKIAAAEIASRAMAGEITPRDAEKELRALPDPMTLWKKQGKSLMSGSVTSTATSAPVKVTTPEEARKLPKGTKIILPDGSEGVVP